MGSARHHPERKERSMTEEEKREKRNARRRKDPYRPLEFVLLFVSTMDGLLDVSAKQCQDYIGMLKYLAMHPKMGDFIPDAATWSRDTCMRVLGIRGKISADCPLFRRENGGIRCKGKTISEIAQLIEERITNRDNATGGGGVKSTCDRMDDRTGEKEEEEEEEETKETPCAGVPNSKNRPQDAQAVIEYARTLDGFMSEEQREKCARTFFDDKEGNGWRDAHGNVIVNWMAAFSAFSQRWQTIAANDRPTARNIRNKNCNASHIYEY